MIHLTPLTLTAYNPSSLAMLTACRTSLRAVLLVAKRAARFGRDGADGREGMDGGRSAIFAQKVVFLPHLPIRRGTCVGGCWSSAVL